jgi:hypothetical protein
MSGHFKVAGLACYQLKRFPQKRARPPVFVHAQRHEAQASQIKRGMMAQRDGDGHVFALCLVLAIDIVDMADLRLWMPSLFFAMELVPVDADVARHARFPVFVTDAPQVI